MEPFAESFKPQVLLLVGNGAIEGRTWEPVAKAKQSFVENFFVKNPCRKDSHQTFLDDALFLAQISFLSRMCRISSDAESREMLDKLDYTRKVLCENYNNILDELRLRELPKVLQTLIDNNDNIGIITTNWEPTIENRKLSKYPLIYLHGNIKDFNSMILPTETVNDHDSLNNAHKKAIDWLENARHLIVWGVGFHEYDAELATIFMCEPKMERRALTIVNPDPKAQARAIALCHITADHMTVLARDVMTSNKELIESATKKNV